MIRNRTILTLTVLLALSIPALAEDPYTQEGQWTLGDIWDDVSVYSIAVDHEFNIHVAGSVNIPGVETYGDFAYYQKFDSSLDYSGSDPWTWAADPISENPPVQFSNNILDIAIDGDNNVYLAGTERWVDYAFNESRLTLLAKFGSDGTEDWVTLEDDTANASGFAQTVQAIALDGDEPEFVYVVTKTPEGGAGRSLLAKFSVADGTLTPPIRESPTGVIGSTFTDIAMRNTTSGLLGYVLGFTSSAIPDVDTNTVFLENAVSSVQEDDFTTEVAIDNPRSGPIAINSEGYIYIGVYDDASPSNNTLIKGIDNGPPLDFVVDPNVDPITGITAVDIQIDGFDDLLVWDDVAGGIRKFDSDLNDVWNAGYIELPSDGHYALDDEGNIYTIYFNEDNDPVLTKYARPFTCYLGDTDGDLDVDSTDLMNVKNYFGDPGPDSIGDADCDGDTDIDDLVAVKNNFGTNYNNPGLTFVPEPASAALLAVGGAVLMRRKRCVM